NRKAPSHESVVGGLDRVVRDGDQMHVEGWVSVGRLPPAVVIAVSGGKIIGEAPVTLYRPDVASASRDPGLMWSGFRMDLPADSLARGGQALRLYCVGFDSYSEFALTATDDQKLKNAATWSVGLAGARVTVDSNGNLEMAGHGVLQNAGQASWSLDQIVRDGEFVRLG